MADSKNYIVKYDIVANTADATKGLQAMLNLAKEMQEPITELKNAINSVKSAMNTLKQSSSLTFAPEINLTKFNNQLKKLVADTETAAGQMHAAIFNALSGNPLGKKIAQKSGEGSFKLAKGSTALKSQLDANEKLIAESIKKNEGLKKTLRNSLTTTQRENATRSIRANQLLINGLQEQNKQIAAALKQAEVDERKATTSKSKESAKKGGAIASGQKDIRSSVTPKTIKEWERVFGNSKSRTLTLQINAKASGPQGALSVIEKVQGSLRVLQEQASFTINPVLNTEGFAAAEAKLKYLADLSTIVTNPFAAQKVGAKAGKGSSLINSLTKQENTQLANAQKQVKKWDNKIATVQSRLDANKAIPEDQRTPAQKGQITRDTKNLATYQANRAAQQKIVSGLQSKVAAGPVVMDVAANLSKINVTGKAPTISVIGKIKELQGTIKKAIPINVKIMANQVQQSLSSIPTPTLDVRVNLLMGQAQEQLMALATQSTVTAQATNASTSTPKTGGTTQGSRKQSGRTGHQPLTAQERYDNQRKQSEDKARKQKADNRLREAKRQQYASQHQGWYNQQQSMYDRLFNRMYGAAPKPDYGWAQRAEVKRAQELAAMRQDAISAFAKPTPFEQQESAARKAVSSNSIAHHQQKANRLRAQAQNAMLPFAQNKEQLNLLTKHRRFFQQATAATGVTPVPGMDASKMLQYLQGVSAQMQHASVAVPWQLQSQINKLEGSIAKAKGVGTPTPQSAKSPTPVSVVEPQKSFYDRARRFAFPFSGPTSFGQRTPMAVDMAKGMGVMYAIGGAMSAIGGSFSQAMEYQNIMRTTEAILQSGTDTYTQSSFKNMEATVRDVGIKTKFSAPEVASAAKFLAMAGYNIEDINNAIRPIADLALIGDHDLGETADKMTNIMTTFSIKPAQMRQAANIMTTTATRSNTDLMMLAESANYGGNMAKLYRESGATTMEAFADTMALFGIMGNSGVQGSSAGTALRMMYMNLFNPNKTQIKTHEKLLKDYGISMYKDDAKTQRRSIADIFIDMAEKIPQSEMADMVSKLFRITATSGGAAVLSQAGISENEKDQVLGENGAIVDTLKKDDQISALAKLLQANRDSINSNISRANAEKKQNTIAGLWSQVTSTFTEGIVRAFESREGYFEEMLHKLRDYFAKPETMRIIQNLFDMIIEIGKVMAWFANIWVSLYNTAPELIKFWVTFQMAMTQIGSLVAPLIGLLSVLDRVKQSILAIAGISAVGGTSVTGGVAAGAAANTLANTGVFIPAAGASGRFAGRINSKYNAALANNAILAGQLALSGADKSHTLKTLNAQTAQHYTAVQERYYRRFGMARAGKAFTNAVTAVPTMASLSSMAGGIKNIAMGLFVGLSKAVGLLMNPVGVAIAGIGALGYGLYKLKQYSDGNTEAQIQRRKELNQITDKGMTGLNEAAQWHKDLNKDNIISVKALQESEETKKKIEEYNAARELFKQRFSWLSEDFSKNASPQSVSDITNKWTDLINSNPIYKLALGSKLDEFTGKNLTVSKNPQLNKVVGTSNSGFVMTTPNADPFKAQALQSNLVEAAMMIEAAHDPNLQKSVQAIIDLYKEKDKYTPDVFNQKINQIREDYVRNYAINGVPLNGMSFDQYSQTYDRSMYSPYQRGAMNILDAYVNQLPGTIVGGMEGQQTLAEKLFKSQEEWYGAVNKVISNYMVFDDFISADGQHQANLGVVLNMLPDGTIDIGSLKRQIEEKIGNFNLSLQQYMRLIGGFYASLEGTKEALKNPEEYQQQLLEQMDSFEMNEQTVRKYFREHVANNKQSPFYGLQEEEFTKFAISPDVISSGWFGWRKKNNTLTQNGKTWLPSNIQKMIKKDIANDTMSLMSEQISGGTTSILNSEQQTADQSSTKTNTKPIIPDQKGYASNYERSAARPTQIINNFHSIASFDRTTVASSAEERDLIATMENRIAGAVYQMFAEASNQAQRNIDLT